jgi:serine/threonine protein kinase
MIQAQKFSLLPRQTVFADSGIGYRVIERLGRGGNSDVYLCLALDGTNKGLLFAVKFMTNVLKGDRVERFNKELAFLMAIEHPSIMKVYDSGSFAFGPSTNRSELRFYVAEYLPKTLADAMRSGLLMVDKISLAVQLLSSLSFLSEKNIVHRDIKPENIFIRGKSAVLGDFGLLKVLEPSELASSFSIGDLSKGVRHPYMYPTPELIEYAKGNDTALTTKSDVFQLGLVFAEVFCGAHPLKARKAPLSEIEIDDLVPFIASNSSTIQSLIQLMVEINVDRRPSAAELLERWDGPFMEVISDAQRLEGRAFW